MFSSCRKMPAHADAIAENRHATKTGLGAFSELKGRKHLSSGEAIANVGQPFSLASQMHESSIKTEN